MTTANANHAQLKSTPSAKDSPSPPSAQARRQSQSRGRSNCPGNQARCQEASQDGSSSTAKVAEDTDVIEHPEDLAKVGALAFGAMFALTTLCLWMLINHL